MDRDLIFTTMLLELGPPPDDTFEYVDWFDAAEAAINKYANTLERSDLSVWDFTYWIDCKKEREE